MIVADTDGVVAWCFSLPKSRASLGESM
jgi:hypothetical protein